MIHELKTEHHFFEDAVEGRKPFEVRVQDRPFAVGDFLALNEIVVLDEGQDPPEGIPPEMWMNEEERLVAYYTGRCALFSVSYLLDNPRFVKQGYCILGIRPAHVGYSFNNMSRVSDDMAYGAPVYDRLDAPRVTADAYREV